MPQARGGPSQFRAVLGEHQRLAIDAGDLFDADEARDMAQQAAGKAGPFRSKLLFEQLRTGADVAGRTIHRSKRRAIEGGRISGLSRDNSLAPLPNATSAPLAPPE